MVQAHASLIGTKKEKDTEEELQKKIQDWFCRVVFFGMELVALTRIIPLNQHECRKRDNVQHMLFNITMFLQRYHDTTTQKHRTIL